MSRHGQRDSSEALELARIEAALARTAPELIPALCWVVGKCHRSRFAVVHPRPPLDELAAVLTLGGVPVKGMLASTRQGLSTIERLPDISEDALLVVRARAAQRVGLGVESVLPIRRRPFFRF